MTDLNSPVEWATQLVQGTSAKGTHGAIAAHHPACVKAGLRILNQGGNAIDAAVAAALVAGVVEPQETTLAGSGFLLVQVPGEDPISVDFGPRAPMSAHANMYEIDRDRSEDRGLGISSVVGDANVVGPLASGVPGTIAGLVTAQEKFGRLTRRAVMLPAIEAAGDGFEAYPSFVLGLAAFRAQLIADPVSASVFFPGDKFPMVPHMGRATFGPPPTLIVNTALARTLEQVADLGVKCLQTGEIARNLLDTVSEVGGLLTAEDLAKPRVRIGSARVLQYRGHDVATTRAPSGGLTELEMLAGWQALHPNTDRIDDEQRVIDFARLSYHVFADRYHWLGDPSIVPVPDDALLSESYARELATLAKDGAATPHLDPGEVFPWDAFARRAVHNPWSYDPLGRAAPVWQPRGGTEPATGTTHVSVIDGAGMAVAVTHTAANLFGAQLMCPRTGLMFDSAMNWFNAEPGAANSIRGSARPLANMGPLLISRNGVPTIALGAPGGRRIASSVVQVSINLLDREMTPDEALAEPRIDASGSRLLVQERLKAVVPRLPTDLEAVIVDENSEFFSAEMARPVIVTRVGDRFEATVHPGSPGGAAAL